MAATEVPRSSDLQRRRSPRWLIAAERATAGIAAAGLVFSLVAWPSFAGRYGSDASRTLAWLAAALGVSYLAHTAWHFARQSTQRPSSPIVLASEVLLACMVGFTLWRGAPSPSLVAGLGNLLCSLLTVSCLAAICTLGGCFFTSPKAFDRADLIRFTIVVAPTAALAALDFGLFAS